MSEKISINRKNLSNTVDAILKQRIKLLTTDYDDENNFIAVIDANREFVFVNNSLLNSLQYSQQDLKGRKVSEFFHIKDKQKDINKILVHVEKQSWSGEITCLRKDNSTFNSRLKITSIRDNNDNLCGYELVTPNIDTSKLNFNKLFEFLLRLEKSYHAFPDLLIIIDESKIITEFRYFDIESDYFVLRPEEGTKLENILPKYIVGEIDLAISKIKTGPQTIYHEFPFTINNNEKKFEAEITRINPYQYSINLRDITKIKFEKKELRDMEKKISSVSSYSIDKTSMHMLNENIHGDYIKTKDGRLLSLEGSYSPVIDENNKVVGFIAKQKEVTSEKKPEQKLLNSDKKFRAIWEKSFDGMRLTDSKGNIVAVNPAFCSMFEMDEAQLLERPFTVVYQEDKTDNERRMKRYRNNFESGSYDFQRYSKHVLHNGKPLFLFVNFTYIKFAEGESLVLGIFRDITELRKTQYELDRVQNLAAIGKMSSYLSHEIKNPLASIKNYVDVLLSNQEMPENTKPILNILRESLGNLSRLLNNVLLFSSNIKLIKIDINIYDLVEKVQELLIHKINKKNIQFKNNLGKNIIPGDYVSLQSVFFNLIENAIDAVANGGIIEINDSVSAGSYVIQIVDNGCGIIEPDKIFEAFHSEKKGGTGLGLVIAKKIMEMHEGNITLIESKPGGTIFELQFPSYSKE